jgi:putative lipase involved disintegration of autophagic bodies
MPVGWEPDDDGFRGYVFAMEDNSTVVLTIKGTSVDSVPIIDGGPTVEKDKSNDNLLFSCCCARVSRTWSPVCDCHRGGWKCDETCVEDALIEDSLFYPLVLYVPLPLPLPQPRLYL